MIAFYIGLTGFACAIYYRRELLRSVKNFFFIGVGPTFGGADPLLPADQERDRTLRPGQLRIRQLLVRDRAAAGDRGLLPLLGIVLMFVQWRKVPAFFKLRPQVVPAGFLEGEAAPPPPVADEAEERAGGLR